MYHIPVTICRLLEPQQKRWKYLGMAGDTGTLEKVNTVRSMNLA